MHRCRFGKAHRVAHETLDSGVQSDARAFDFLRALLADFVLLRVDMALIGASFIGINRVIPNGSSKTCSCRK